MMKKHRSTGFSLIEVLIALLITAIGLLGMIGLQARAQQAQFETLQRVQGMLLVNDIVDRMGAYRNATFNCLADWNAATDFLGTGSGLPATIVALNDCSAPFRTDLTAWHNSLLGSGVTQGATEVGGLIDARGCLQLTAGGASAPDLLRVVVSWQGQFDTFDPGSLADPLDCGNASYADQRSRRAVGVWFAVAELAGV